MSEPLLVEIGCEEIPARMIRGAAEDLSRRLVRLLDEAGLGHGAAAAWGGSRRLAVRVEGVAGRQADRDETVVGPPVEVALAAGQPTPAGLGFARKQGLDPRALEILETERGRYVGVRRRVAGKGLGQVLAAALPGAVESMTFPKTMRWSAGRHRWVRPVHWLVALHGSAVLELELFGVGSGRISHGHRFLGAREVTLDHADHYVERLAAAHVVVDPAERRRRLAAALASAAAEAGGLLVEDSALLDEVVDLVEWPGVVTGGFERAFLELPRELLVTTLRHHQKCFSVQSGEGELRPVFLAVANTDRDPGGHVRRGNEWVVVGRLEDARFFWREDRRTGLAARADRLSGVTFHARAGSYADKAARMADLAATLARRIGADEATREHAREAAGLAKVDLVTGTVGEFPELQGLVGGLLLRAEGAPAPLADGVYEHYRPAGADDRLPASPVGAIVSVADKLDTLAALLAAGESATSSRDPFGLRRAASGVFRVVLERRWPLALSDLLELASGGEALGAFLRERFQNHLRDGGATANEVAAVVRAELGADEWTRWPLDDVAARVAAIRGVRQREDFARLVELTKRVDTILVRNAGIGAEAEARAAEHREGESAAVDLARRVDELEPRLASLARERSYDDAVATLAGFVDPVHRFFEDVLVIDPERPAATAWRYRLLARLGDQLTRYFDIRELAGQSERRS